ncbi:unnamed protein product [Ilex paraguariensis]|uniref:Gnk2-homologous domain-containing protein n=1 Tax=Ilex paraguariensis TaxID=185542 RepID=A0ABC8SXF7_9AQUA
MDRDTVNCSSPYGKLSGNEAERSDFQKRVGGLIENVTEIAVLDGGFGVFEMKGVYGLAQCWKTVSKDGCRECLEKAGQEVRGCLPSREGRGLNAGCYLRYSTVKFYSDSEKMKENSGN